MKCYDRKVKGSLQVTHLAPFPDAIQLFETRMADTAFGPDTLYPRDRDYQAPPICRL
ncbi:MAG: hypothetical protein ACFB12_19440 [Leptolyngbyaceae cyanobacterium]